MFYSPLRYPGGKNKLAAFLAKICVDNRIDGHYVEPFAGGASVALFLLIEGFVNRITINDKDRSVYAFWFSVLYDTEKLIARIENAEFNIDVWRQQKELQQNKEDADLLDLGFSTLYLNRTNRSGIIKAGVIGGIEQKGNYKMDCRFNKKDIIERIKIISELSDKITLCNFDALDLIDYIEHEAGNNRDNTIFYFDPPYYLKADTLYMNYFDHENHKEISDRIAQIDNMRWVVSYDNHDEIKELYLPFNKKEYTFNHSAFSAREGKEILFFSEGLAEPGQEDYNPVNYKLERIKNGKQIVYKQKKLRKVQEEV